MELEKVWFSNRRAKWRREEKIRSQRRSPGTGAEHPGAPPQPPQPLSPGLSHQLGYSHLPYAAPPGLASLPPDAYSCMTGFAPPQQSALASCPSLLGPPLPPPPTPHTPHAPHAPPHHGGHAVPHCQRDMSPGLDGDIVCKATYLGGSAYNCASRNSAYDSLGVGYGSRATNCSPMQSYQMNGHHQGYGSSNGGTSEFTGLLSPGVSVPLAVPGAVQSSEMQSQYWSRLQ